MPSRCIVEQIMKNILNNFNKDYVIKNKQYAPDNIVFNNNKELNSCISIKPKRLGSRCLILEFQVMII